MCNERKIRRCKRKLVDLIGDNPGSDLLRLTQILSSQ